jgi:UDP-N-acetylmuramoyl-L-alanyl-D-glutamate--2,6-diaminopimelate ligase
VCAAPLWLLLREIQPLNPRGEPALPPAADRPVTGVAYDHRQVAPGSVFVCLRGSRHDGHAYAAAAAAAGACLVVGEQESLAASIAPVPYLRVDDARRALALFSCAFHAHPSRDLRLTGVTGTNGKTSFTHLLHAVHCEAGLPSAILGTLGSGTPIAGAPETAPLAEGRRAADLSEVSWHEGIHTTPESPDLQAELGRWRAAGIRAGAMEVSSHGLALRRSYGTRFACVVFTNLTEDHLDFHGTMEAYREAKSLLFHPAGRGVDEPPSVAVVNGDDPSAPELLRGSPDRVVWYGRGTNLDVRLTEVETGPTGIRMRVHHPAGVSDVVSSLLGSFQADNLLAAFAAGLALGIDPAVVARGLGRARAIPGRMERIDGGQTFAVLVDYAHTPDALHRALTSLRPFTPGRIIAVFGCGGERDRAKRPLMGEVAARDADVIFLTDDNPRHEDPAAIRREARAGIEAAGGDCREIAERGDAIRTALLVAREGDTVLIAGKGHETTQQRGDDFLPFDDREVARKLLHGWPDGLLDRRPDSHRGGSS